MDNPDTPSEQTGISEDIGKNGHIEVIGRASDVSLYYYDPIQPMVIPEVFLSPRNINSSILAFLDTSIAVS